MSTTEIPPAGAVVAADSSPDLTAAPEAAAAVVPASLTAQTFGDYWRAVFQRVRGGDAGLLPVITGLIIITIVFQILSPNGVFISAGNFVNLFQQSAVFMVLAMAEGFALLLGEIDLSIGFAAGVGGAIAVQLVQPTTTKWPWFLAILAVLIANGAFGYGMGMIITRFSVPSFVVTLAGSLVLNGAMLIIVDLGPFSGTPSLIGNSSNLTTLYNLMWGTIDPTVSWIAMFVVVAAYGALLWTRDTRRRSSGLVAPPVSLTLMKIGGVILAGVVVVLICNINRAHFGTLSGVPWVIPIVLGVLLLWTVLLTRMRFGRYVYSIGGNPEAARRAGVNVSTIRTTCFALCGATAGFGGILYASLLGGASSNVNGGQLVLFAVAAAVIGGTSLFGGRGKPIHGVLGGLVIGAIYNGMYLLSLEIQWQLIATGAVLIVAVLVDSLSRRAGAQGSAAR